jgi:hypothetical protein
VWALSGDLSECSSKGGRIVIAGSATNLVDWLAGRLEEALCVMNADLLQVSLWPVPSCGGESPIESADAKSELRGQFGGLDGLIEMGIDVLLDPMNDDVIMGASRQSRDVGQLAGPMPVDE